LEDLQFEVIEVEDNRIKELHLKKTTAGDEQKIKKQDKAPHDNG